jgi:hypothetical protein
MESVDFNDFNCVVKFFLNYGKLLQSLDLRIYKFLFYTVKEMTEGKIETSFFKRYYVNSITIVSFVNNVKNIVLK